MIEKKEVTIYTDGGCRGNGQGENIGGYGIILTYVNKKTEKVYEKEIKKGFRNTTNNVMELLAVIDALKALKEPCVVRLYSDSAYVINALNAGWLEKWQKNGWKTSDKQDVKNKELWVELIELLKIHDVKFIKVKGHAYDEYNNRCDKLANEAMDELWRTGSCYAINNITYDLSDYLKIDYVDYTGKSIKCITNKYVNYTNGKLYKINNRSVMLDGRPSGFYILDDDGEISSVESLLRKKKSFILV